MSRILVVDDRPVERDFLRTLLTYDGHTIEEASDGGEALYATLASKPDLVIVDLLMPTMDGFEFVRRVRSEASIANTRVIFYTASYLEAEARELARQCGVNYIITKPAEPEELLRIVRESLGSSRTASAPPLLDRFRDEHLRLISSKLLGKTEALLPQLDALIDLNLQMASVRDTSELLDIFCASARQIIGARESVVRIHDNGSPSRIWTSGLQSGLENSLRRATGEGKMAEIEKSGKGGSGQGASANQLGLPAGHPDIESWAAASIHSPTQTFGWICVTNRLGALEFSPSDVRLLTILAAQVGRIYEGGRLFQLAQSRAEILEREVAERRSAERHFRAVFDAALDAMVVFDDQGRMLEFNSATEMLYGRSREELQRSKIDAFSPPGTDPTPLWREFAATGKLRAFVQLVRPDQSIREVEFVSQANFLPGRHLTVMRDVTEQRKLEEQFRQAQKMEVIGSLAGGVAHDFNNLLTVINGYAEILVKIVPEGQPREFLQEIASAGEMSAQLTRQLLAFSRRQVIQPEILVLNSVISRISRMLRRIIGENVELVEQLSPTLGSVKADSGQMEQVIMNLVVNARDAMPRGGRLTIRTGNIEVEAADCAGRPGASPGSRVLLMVNDTGHGMDNATLKRIFEPFFTTKPAGQGTGLGLATVFGIVAQSGGHIQVTSEVGEGSSFAIYIPRVAEQQPHAREADTSVRVRGSETLIVAEDAPVVRELTCRILQGAGYEVLPAASGAEALLISQKHTGPIQGLVTDVVMQGISGVQLATQLSEQRPGLKVLFVSGYTQDNIVAFVSPDAALDLLQKPFKPSVLLERVRRTLDGKPPPRTTGT